VILKSKILCNLQRKESLNIKYSNLMEEKKSKKNQILKTVTERKNKRMEYQEKPTKQREEGNILVFFVKSR
jgi:hypothetical protein